MRDKILFVDDKSTYRELVISHFVEEGWPEEIFLQADDFYDAIAIWEKNRAEIGLVLVDGYFPGGNADALIGYFRSDNPDMPILLISTDASDWREKISTLASEDRRFQNVFIISKMCLRDCSCGKCGADGREGFVGLVLRLVGQQTAAEPKGPGRKAEIAQAKL